MSALTDVLVEVQEQHQPDEWGASDGWKVGCKGCPGWKAKSRNWHEGIAEHRLHVAEETEKRLEYEFNEWVDNG